MATEAMLEMPAIKIGTTTKRSSDNFFFTEVGKNISKVNLDTIKSMNSFADMFPVKGSMVKEDLASLLARAKKDPVFLKNDVKTAYGIDMPKPKVKDVVYSVKLEADGTTKIFTLRAGKDFTELSLVKNGKLVEILRQEGNNVTCERF